MIRYYKIALHFMECVWIFLLGASAYLCIELLWRGFTHWSMAFAGGGSFLALYIFDTVCPRKPLRLKCLWGAAVITAVEFTVGCVVNLWLGLGVWDYGASPLNILGQVCPVYSFLWFALCFVLFPACRPLRAAMLSRYEEIGLPNAKRVL